MSSKKVKISFLRQYEEAGWGFLKLHHWKEVDEHGKHLAKVPSDLWGRGTKSLNYSDIVDMMESAEFNVGAEIPRGWLVVDIDVRNLEPGMNVNRMAALLGFDLGDETLDYPLIRSGGGGVHLICRAPEGMKLRKDNPALYKGVDIKQFGGYVVAAGSVHESGNYYYIEGTPEGGIAAAPIAPQKVLDGFKYDGLPANKFGVSPDEIRQTYGRVSPEGIEYGLSFLDPANFNMNETWFNLLCSVHWASGGLAEEEFVTWSLLDPTYKDHEEVIRTRWESLGHGDSTASSIRSGLFFKCIKEAGANIFDKLFQRSAMDDFLDLKEDECEEYNGGISPKVTAMKAAVAGSTLGDLLASHFVVNVDGKAAIATMAHSSTGRKTQFMDIRSFNLMYSNVRENDGTATTMSWMESPLRKTYHGIDFLPDEAPGEVYEPVSGKFIYNLWTGFELEPVKGDWSQFRRLLLEGMCRGDETHLKFFLDWIAYKYQNLGGPVGVATVLRGKKGAGKSTVWEVIAAPFGGASLATAKSEDVFGSHNSLMMNKVMLCLEEAFWSGNHSVGSQLKSLITNQTLTVNPKFLNAMEIMNNLALLVLTNEGWSIPATEDERRYFCLDFGTQFINDHIFWDSIKDKKGVKTHIKQAFFYDMLQRDITDFNPYRDLPKTEELAVQVRQSKMRSAGKALYLWVQDRLNHLAVQEEVEYIDVSPAGIVRVIVDEAYMNFRNYVEQNSLTRYMNNDLVFKSSFEKELLSFFPAGYASTLKRKGETESLRALRLGTKEYVQERYDYHMGDTKAVDDEDEL